MHPEPAVPPKPVTTKIRHDITRLPVLTPWRRFIRRLLVVIARILVFLFLRPSIKGLENIPQDRPAVVVSNHLGDADFVLGLAATPVLCEIFAKADLLYEYPMIGKLLDAYGVIWIHRGQPDRKALRIALECLDQGRLVAIAPEARESLTGALEEGTFGAAYLAIKAGVPLLPVTFTGTENKRVYNNMRRLRRTDATLTAGKLFELIGHPDRHRELELGTQQIMIRLAEQLPAEYRGIYAEKVNSQA